ncbi:MAG: hypothetical protein B0D92_06805 [Spirochaeta sp. LUC14_002_19_P3]|nr:MAG: hypothetical protein B0D92_06805 [Spirochaeta sp. LUC14_002_19_P3]
MKKSYCAIDFETGCYESASACAVGAARIRKGVVSEKFYSLIKPPAEMPILPRFTSLHGIDMEEVSEAPTFAELWPELSDFIGSDILLAHNAPFDKGVLQSVLEFYGLDYHAYTFECTVRLSRNRWPHLQNHKLNTLCQHLGIELNHHEALSDAMACAQIFLEAARV